MAHPRKLRVVERVEFHGHRSGWRYAISALEPLLVERGGVRFDTFIENNFYFFRDQATRDRVVPYQEPWLGFVHVPPGVPPWYEHQCAPQVIFELPIWRASMAWCRGLLVLSAAMAAWLRPRVAVPVLALTHPTETPELGFSMAAFEDNPDRRVVQIGMWLRRMHSIFELPVRRLGRALQAGMGPERQDRVRATFERERAALGLGALDRSGVAVLDYLSDGDYDRMLSRNIAFVHLYDSAANNVVIECIVRTTPILVNRIPSVIEYLGPEYPFYFETLEEAARKADDAGAVRAAHEHLRALPKRRFSGEHFLEELAGSELYRAL